jgi:hypothetical protein
VSKGNLALIDGVAALAIILLLSTIVAFYTINNSEKILEQDIEKETLRAQFYGILFSGGVQGLVNYTGAQRFEVGGLIFDRNMPSGVFLQFFVSDSNGVRVYYVYEKG